MAKKKPKLLTTSERAAWNLGYDAGVEDVLNVIKDSIMDALSAQYRTYAPEAWPVKEDEYESPLIGLIREKMGSHSKKNG